jgi:hypothetical protein
VAGDFMAAEGFTAVAAVAGSSNSHRNFGSASHNIWRENTIMRHPVTVEKFGALRPFTLLAIRLLLATSLVPGSFAQTSTQKSFPSAEAASHALYVAVQSDNDQVLVEILGGGTELVSANDTAEDKLEHEQFGKKYEEMHRLVREPDGTTVLYVGAENWPFPVPLVSKSGEWYFDGAAGKEEVLFRRIGENEAGAIETCHALVITRKQQVITNTADDTVVQYAESFVASHEMNGKATPPGGKDVTSGPFHGYNFRMLRGQSKGGGVSAKPAFIAYPAEYRSSGVMTFVVTGDGAVYRKDLGPDGAQLAKKMNAFSLSSSWRVVE